MLPTYLNFDHENYSWRKDIDYRKHPELYKVGKGEQGVLICEPYKTEIGAHWRFRNPEIARKSSLKILDLFHDYMAAGEFVGADMARKYLQMGFTRARRYANYKTGKKYDSEDNYSKLPKGTGDEEKAISATIFYEAWQQAEALPDYASVKNVWRKKYG